MITTDKALRHQPIGFLLRKLDRLLDERFERTLGAFEVTRRQWQLMNTLLEGPATKDALSGAVAPFLDKSPDETVEQHLTPLLERGVVERDGDAYELTPSGRALFVELRDHVRSTRELTTRGLADGEYERTLANLSTMIQNLEQA